MSTKIYIKNKFHRACTNVQAPRLSKKSRKDWAFFVFCGIIFMVMKDDEKRI